MKAVNTKYLTLILGIPAEPLDIRTDRHLIIFRIALTTQFRVEACEKHYVLSTIASDGFERPDQPVAQSPSPSHNSNNCASAIPAFAPGTLNCVQSSGSRASFNPHLLAARAKRRSRRSA